jgi:hypothetical protein
MKTKAEWEHVALRCETAYLCAPKYSPYKLIFKLGMWYALRKMKQA